MHDCEKHIRKDFRAAECDDQLEFTARVGRGVKGDSYKVEVEDDPKGQATTTLHGYTFDETFKDWIKVWDSENINGGRLYLSEKININDEPRSFTLTFIYKRPGRQDWHLVTPAIPYLHDHPRRGSDVADVMLMDHSKCKDTGECDMWKDPLVYDQDLPREDFNAPNPPGGKSKVSDTPVEHKGDVWGAFLDVAEFNELAKILGWTYEDLVKSINVETGRFTKPLKGKKYTDVEADDVLDFIETLVKKIEIYFEDKIAELRTRMQHLEAIVAYQSSSLQSCLEALTKKFYGNNNVEKTTHPLPVTPVPIPTTYDTYSIDFENDNKAAVGNINVYGWPGNDPNSGGLLQTHKYGNGEDDHPGDIKAQ